MPTPPRGDSGCGRLRPQYQSDRRETGSRFRRGIPQIKSDRLPAMPGTHAHWDHARGIPACAVQARDERQPRDHGIGSCQGALMRNPGLISEALPPQAEKPLGVEVGCIASTRARSPSSWSADQHERAASASCCSGRR